jgi:hypothetical protein
MFCLVPAVIALAVGLGARYPDFKSENPALVATSFGGLLFMLCAFGLIAAVIILEAGPLYYAFMTHVLGRNLSFTPDFLADYFFFHGFYHLCFRDFFPHAPGRKILKKVLIVCRKN